MAFQLLIGNARDYSEYVCSKLGVSNILWVMNKPQVLSLSLLSVDSLFGDRGVPRRDEKVILHTSYGNNTFTGFISAHPVMELQGYVSKDRALAGIHTSSTIGNLLLSLPVNAYVGYNVKIISGTGAGQSRNVTSNIATTVTVDVAWNPEPQDNSYFVLSAPIFGYRIVATSEEYQLNAMSERLVLLPSLVGRKTGAIIRIMTEYLLPGKFSYGFDDTAGEYQASFEIKAGESWSDIVGKMATADRCHYWVLNGTIYYAQVDDGDLGVVYDLNTDPAVTGWNVANMSVDPEANTVKNDVIVLGGDCPRGMGKAFFIGDGYEGNFHLQAKAYGIESSIEIHEDWSSGYLANAGTWECGLGGGWIDYSNLQLSGGDGVDSTYMRLQKSLELSGSLRLIHGDVMFSNASEGRIGCLYRNFNDLADEADVLFGFKLTKSGGQTRIRAIVNGVVGTESITTIANHSYTFVTYLNSKQVYPWSVLVRSFSDYGNAYGGGKYDYDLNMSLEVWEYDTDTQERSQIKVLAAGNNNIVSASMVDPFMSYVVIQAVDMHLALQHTELARPMQAFVESRKPIIDPYDGCPTSWEDPRIRPIGFGVDQADATITSDNDGHVLQFYPNTELDDNIPVACERLEIFFRVLGKAIGRVQDSVSIAEVLAIFGSPDDGIRTVVIDNFVPVVRTDEDARHAAAAYIADSVKPSYRVDYKVPSTYVTDRPMPGRMLAVNERRFYEPCDLLVTQVKQEIYGDHLTKADFHVFTITCGTILNADVIAALLRRKGDPVSVRDAANTDIIDVLDVDTEYLGDEITNWEVAPNIDTSIYDITVVDPTYSAYSVEVRKWDRGWGQVISGQDSGLVVRTAAGVLTFSISRYSRQQMFYMRFCDSSNPRKYSSKSAYCKVGWPLKPLAVEAAYGYAESDYKISLNFDIPETGFQDIWRIEVMNDIDSIVYATFMWDAVAFSFVDYMIESADKFTIPGEVNIYTRNLLGERSNKVVVPISYKQPYVWQPFEELNPTTGEYAFYLKQLYSNKADGTIGTFLRVKGKHPVNVFHSTLLPPVITDDSLGTIAGSIPVGTYYVGLVAQATDADGVKSTALDIDDICSIVLDSESGIKIMDPVWDASTAYYDVFIGTSPWKLSRQVSGSGKPTLINIADYVPNTFGPPDALFDHYMPRTKKVYHSGVWGQPIDDIPVGIEGHMSQDRIFIYQADFIWNEWNGRYIIILGDVDSQLTSDPMPVWEYKIIATFDEYIQVQNLDGSTADLIADGVEPGDVMVMRSMPDLVTTSPPTYRDLKFINDMITSMPVLSYQEGADPASVVLEVKSHGCIDGDIVRLDYMAEGGCPELDGDAWVVSMDGIIDGDHLKIVGGYSQGSYTGGGTLQFQGMRPGEEVGRLLRIIRGTGVGQVRPIVGNTQTTIEVDDWEVVPDATSVAIVEAANWSWEAPGTEHVKNWRAPDDPDAAGIDILIPADEHVGAVAMVAVPLATANDQMTDIYPFREIYVNGVPQSESPLNYTVKEKATFGIGIGMAQDIGNDLTPHYLIREKGNIIDCAGSTKNPQQSGNLYIDVEYYEGGTWKSIFPPGNTSKLVIGTDIKQYIVVDTMMATVPFTVEAGGFLRINLLDGSAETARDIEVVVRWGIPVEVAPAESRVNEPQIQSMGQMLTM